MRTSYAIAKPTFKEQVREFMWFNIPKFFTYFVILVSFCPISISKLSDIRPCLAMAPIFYWAVYRPHSFSAKDAFIVGLVLDFFETTPLGLNTLVMTLFYILSNSQRRFLFTHPFGFVWCIFGLFGCAGYVLKWLLASVNYATFLPFKIVFISQFLVFLFYPLICPFCDKLHRILRDHENDGT